MRKIIALKKQTLKNCVHEVLAKKQVRKQDVYTPGKLKAIFECDEAISIYRDFVVQVVRDYIAEGMPVDTSVSLFDSQPGILALQNYIADKTYLFMQEWLKNETISM